VRDIVVDEISYQPPIRTSRQCPIRRCAATRPSTCCVLEFDAGLTPPDLGPVVVDPSDLCIGSSSLDVTRTGSQADQESPVPQPGRPDWPSARRRTWPRPAPGFRWPWRRWRSSSSRSPAASRIRPRRHIRSPHDRVSRQPSDRENAPRSSRGQGGAPERSEDERP